MMKYELEGHEFGTGSSGDPNDGFVKVIHGANDGIFDVAEETVASVQASLAHTFNIPVEAFAFVNGEIVGEEYRLRAQDNLVFSLLEGWKGGKVRGDESGFKPIRPPFPYYGGKARVAPEVWRRFGEVKNYVEPFFGGGGVLLNRPIPAGAIRKETVNDIDSLLANFWRALKLHPRKLASVADFPVSEVDLHARHPWLVNKRSEIAEKMRTQEAWCDPKVAAWWVWGISQWIGGGWCEVGNQSRRIPNRDGRGVHRQSHQRPVLEGCGVHRNCDKPRREMLREYYSMLSARLERVNIVNGDWSRVVTPSVTTRYGLTGVFLDPPYTAESGRSDRLYAEDDLRIGHDVRDWAVAHGHDPKLRIAVCGYDGEYRMPSTWTVFDWKSTGSRNGHRERIWFSPNCLP